LSTTALSPRAWLTIAGFAVAGAVGGAWLWTQQDKAPAQADAAVGGPFRLVDQAGAAVDERVLRGKWSAVFFGYTYCPDVCPTTLVKLGQASEALGPDAARFQAVFITVDPGRDTPRALTSYLSSPAFPRGTIGLTGSAGQIAAVARAYHVYYQKIPQGSSYSMDHSAVLYLMDPQGRFSRALDIGASPAELARQVRQAMAGG
jgi:protein SCO1